MKPVSFEYARPRGISEALGLAGSAGDDAKVLAGGQSLGPMLNMRLVQPRLVVDITNIAEFKRAEDAGDDFAIGACVTHADIEDGRVPDVTGGALPSVARNIAYRAVRNRGTIGGSLCHADPAADWVSSLSALGAKVVLRSKGATRVLPVENYVTGALETALGPGELLDSVLVPKLSSRAQWGFFKACRKTGEFAHAIGAVLFDPARDVCRIVMGAVDARPIVVAKADRFFGGKPGGNLASAFDIGAADEALSEAGIADPISRKIHRTALQRAVQQASQ